MTPRIQRGLAPVATSLFALLAAAPVWGQTGVAAPAVQPSATGPQAQGATVPQSSADAQNAAGADAQTGGAPIATAQSNAIPSPDTAVSEVVVRGVRGSLLRSIETKRDASTIVDAISAEELGKFPNRNVAEALANIPGVTVGHDGRGEGRNITVRGLGENFAITTLNGRILPTDGTDRSFAFDILPSEMISGAEVIKAVQSSSLEGSIGGNIDLRTARPFDRPGLHMSGSAEGQYTSLSGEPGYKLSGVVSDTFADNRFGVLASLTYSDYKFRTDNLGEYSPASDTEDGQQVDFNGNGVIDQDGKKYIWPLFYSNGVVLGERKRLGASTAVQWKASDTLTFTVDGLYSHYDDSEHNYRQSNFLSPRNDPSSPLKWIPGSVKTDANGVVTNFALNDLVAEVLTTDEPRTVDTYQVGGHVDWRPVERLKLAVDGYYGEASRDSGGKNRFVVAGIPDSSGVFATRNGDLPDLAITIPGGRPISAATDDDFHAHYIGIQGDNLRDRIESAKLDGTFDVDWSLFKSISFGGAWTDRRKQDTTIDNQYTTSCNYCGYPFTFGSIGAQVVRPFPVTGLLANQPGNFTRNFPVFDIDTYLKALPKADNNPAILDPNTGEPYPAGYSTQIIQPDLQASFLIDERTYAGYIQANLGGDRWKADVGVRIVNTSVSSTGNSASIASIVKRPGNTADFQVVFNPVAPVTGGGEYTKALPAVNFSYDIMHGLKLRLAASQAISRPTFGELSPASDASNAQSGTFIIYDAGNPNLKPTTANQFDASLEYYPNSKIALTAAFFYKDIKDFVTSLPTDVTITPTNQPAGQPASFDFTRVRVLNGDSAEVKGVEVGGQYFLGNGFGAQANVTYTDSTAKTGDLTTDLAGAIPFSANAKLFYENHGIQAQVSYSYTSRYTYAQAGLIDYLPIKEEPYHEMSASISYDLNKHLSIYAEGSNLLDSAIKRFNTYQNVPAFYEFSGRAFFVGVRARL